MAAEDTTEILQELQGLVHDELKVLSYKWVARHYSIPANLAKRVLFQFAEQQRDQVRTVYLISGWSKDSTPTHVHRLVEADQLQVRREELSQVTGMHVYSVAPAQPVNPDLLWQTTFGQAQQLLKELLAGEATASAEAFRSNSCSAVRFVPQQRAPGAAAVGAAPAKPAAAAPAAPPAKAAATAPVAAKAVAPHASEGAPTAAPPPVATAAAGQSPPKGVGSSPPKAAGGKAAGKGAAPAAAPAAAAASGKGGNTLATMWGKAGAKAKPAVAAVQEAVKEEPTVACGSKQGAVEPQQEQQQQQGQEDEDDVVVGGGRGRKRRNAQIADEEDEEEREQPAVASGSEETEAPAEAPAPAAGKGAKGGKAAKASGKGTAGAKDKAPAKGAAKRAKKGAAEQAGAPAPEGGSEPQEQAAMEVDADSGDMDAAVAHALDASEGGAEPPPAVTAVAQQPAARGTAGGRGRRVMRTYINDMGEEVTEEVAVEEEGPLGAAPTPAAPASAAAPAAGPKGGSKPAAAPAAKAAPAKTKGKPLAQGQKSMMSFFKKQ